MRSIAVMLMLAVFLRHNAVNGFAASWGMTPAAVAYVLGGAWETILCAAVMLFTFVLPRTIWRAVIRCAMAVGMVEGAQITACRLAIEDISSVPRGTSLCDYVSGFPIGATITAFYILIIAWVLGRATRTA